MTATPTQATPTPLKTVREISEGDARYANLTSRFTFIDHSWFTNAPILSHVLSSLRPTAVCEVGSWMGASSRFIASAPGVQRVVCVDHWDRTLVENWTPGAHPEDWMDHMFEHFLANCYYGGVQDKIQPARMTSDAGSAYLAALGERFDLIYIDGAHRSDVVRRDLRGYYPLLKKGGFFCGDDWQYATEPENVQGTVLEHAAEVGARVLTVGNFWWYHF